MKKTSTKVISLLLIICLLFGFSGCVFDDMGNDVAEMVVGEFVSEKNDPVPTGKSGANEQLLYETVLLEEVIEEDLLNEKIIKERIVNEITNDEQLIAEDIELESVKVGVYEDINEIDDDFLCESYYSVDMDYSFIKQRIAAGAALVLAEVIIDTGSAIINLVTCNWGGLALDLGQIIVTAGGTTISAFVAAQIAKAKSLAAGNSYEMAMYDALYEGSNAFYYTAVAIDAVNTIISLGQLVDAGVKGVKVLKNFIASKQSIKVLDSAGNVVGKATAKGTVEVTADGVKKSCRTAMSTNLDGTSIDVYDTVTKEYVATLSKSGDALLQTQRAIPNEILLKAGDNVGKAKYVFNGADAFKVTYAADGSACKTWIGTIDQGGFVKNNWGQIIKKIDFDTGRELNGFSKLLKAPAKNPITVDVFGELIEITNVQNKTAKALSKKTVKGVVTYLDSANNRILVENLASDGVTYLMRVSENINDAKVAGALSEGAFDFNWKATLDYVRSKATGDVRKALVDYVKNNNVMAVRQNFPELTLEMIDYIKQYGKVPTSIQIHHCKNVANFPDLAGDYSNLVVVTKETHLAEHFGDFHNATTSKPSCYVDLNQVLTFPEVA